MTPEQPLSRRGFSLTAAATLTALGAARSAAADPGAPPSDTDLGISTSNRAIHQAAFFPASPARLYHALTDAVTFDRVVLASGALQAMGLAKSPCQIGAAPGEAFSLFGGYITGRQIEMTPGVRLVQAWRAGGWPPHIHSIARFELTERAGGVALAFDHTGFPNEEARSLASGWRRHYWEPLAKVLA